MAKKKYSAEDVIKLQQLINSMNIDSLDRPLKADDFDTLATLGDCIEDRGPTPDDIVAEREFKELISKAVRALSPIQAKVIELHYGLNNNEPMTLEEIGQHFGVTRSRIQQIEAKALKKLHWLLLVRYKIMEVE